MVVSDYELKSVSHIYNNLLKTWNRQKDQPTNRCWRVLSQNTFSFTTRIDCNAVKCYNASAAADNNSMHIAGWLTSLLEFHENSSDVNWRASSAMLHRDMRPIYIACHAAWPSRRQLVSFDDRLGLHLEMKLLWLTACTAQPLSTQRYRTADEYGMQ